MKDFYISLQTRKISYQRVSYLGNQHRSKGIDSARIHKQIDGHAEQKRKYQKQQIIRIFVRIKNNPKDVNNRNVLVKKIHVIEHKNLCQH